MSFLSRIDRSGGHAIKRSPTRLFRESIAKLRHKEQHSIGRSDRERSRNPRKSDGEVNTTRT